MKKPKFNFYLNPHDQYKWTKCPKCEGKTKVRKICLMIHYEEKAKKFHQLFSLNKTCKFCPSCALLIAQKPDLDVLMGKMVVQFGVEFNPANYFVFGTMDKKDWVKTQKERTPMNEAIELAAPFKDVWEFEIQPAGWYFDGE